MKSVCKSTGINVKQKFMEIMERCSSSQMTNTSCSEWDLEDDLSKSTDTCQEEQPLILENPREPEANSNQYDKNPLPEDENSGNLIKTWGMAPKEMNADLLAVELEENLQKSNSSNGEEFGTRVINSKVAVSMMCLVLLFTVGAGMVNGPHAATDAFICALRVLSSSQYSGWYRHIRNGRSSSRGQAREHVWEKKNLDVEQDTLLKRPHDKKNK
ncbi:uncharacterized protein LOC122812883 isoform X2 [Protopterus annectens]|uniref:uncharacterized protein LOC122812883 isoform X2 n=1 Tax=Protopterus annectens TaxID=7888 RepID=UPI001CFC39FC|nr:uncharacterized protein LOC122812883 isoform X2 [Protopterus annectens]